MGIHHSNFHSIDIDMAEYKTHKFIAAIDCETVLGASFSGLNIKNGSLLTAKCKHPVQSLQNIQLKFMSSYIVITSLT
jgi:hypothetical protein